MQQVYYQINNSLNIYKIIGLSVCRAKNTLYTIGKLRKKNT